MTERRGHARTYVLSVTRADAKAKPLELERQARCKRRATAASRRSARAHLPGRAPRAAESPRPQRAPLLRLLFDVVGSAIKYAVKGSRQSNAR